nr:hypothetical protein [Tanacetum cinerariifolium]
MLKLKKLDVSLAKDNDVQRLKEKENAQRNYYWWFNISVVGQIKKVNDVVQLRVLIDGKKEIFEELARMGYEKSPSKLTFCKALQWKFLIHTLVQCLSAKRTAWNEFSYSMASAVICLATGRKFNFSKYIFDSMVRNVDSPSKFLMYLRFLQVVLDHQVDNMTTYNTRYTSLSITQKVLANMRRVGKGFSGVETLLFAFMLVHPQTQAEEGVEIPLMYHHPQQLKKRVKKLEKKKRSKSSGLKRLRRVGTTQKVESSTDTVLGAHEDASKQGKGKIAAIDADKGITLVDVETDKKVVAMDAESQGRLNQEDVNAASKGVSVVSAPELVSVAEPTIFNDEDVSMTMDQNLIKLKAEKAKLLDKHIAQKLHDEEVQKDAARDKQEKAAMKRALELQRQYDDKEENIDWSDVAKQNMASYKMEFFREMTYDKESFKKLRAAKVSGSESTHEIPSNDPKEMIEEDVQNMLEIIPVPEFKVETLQVKYPIIDWKIDTEEKDYPLSNAIMILMLSGKLQVEEDNEIARDLVMKNFMEANKPRSRSLDTSS